MHSVESSRFVNMMKEKLPLLALAPRATACGFVWSSFQHRVPLYLQPSSWHFIVVPEEKGGEREGGREREKEKEKEKEKEGEGEGEEEGEGEGGGESHACFYRWWFHVTPMYVSFFVYVFVLCGYLLVWLHQYPVLRIPSSMLQSCSASRRRHCVLELDIVWRQTCDTCRS